MGFCSNHVSADPRPPPPDPLKCPRCASANTKFCYYNNYNKSQPRHFCKSCKRHWTHGGTLRNIPLGGAARRNHKRPRPNIISSIPTSTNKHAPSPAPNFPNNHKTMATILYQALIRSSSPLLPITTHSIRPQPDRNPTPNLNPGSEFQELISSGLSSSTTAAAAAAATATASLIPNRYQTWYDCSQGGANLVDCVEESTITSVDHNHINPWPSPDYSSTTPLELDHHLSSNWSCSWNEIDAALTSSADDLINVGWDDDDDDDVAKIKP